MNKNVPKTWMNDDHFLSAISSSWYKLIVLLENEIAYATYDFYRAKNIFTFHLPITTGSISSPMGLGSDSKPVKIKMFGIDTYLADSMQFMLEYGCRLHNNGCFYIMPSFRGESCDKRHLSQFYHSEAEIPGGLNDVMSLVEQYIKFISVRILQNCKKELVETVGTVDHIEAMVKRDVFNVIDYFDAVKMLEGVDGCLEYINGNYCNITSAGERLLMEKFDGVVWLKNIDKMIVPFYQAVNPNNSRAAMCADLLFGVGEVVGSGERHQTGEQVKSALDIHQIDEEEYGWYIKMKEAYPLKTAGFGMGIERFLLWILKHDDIRDCQILVRQNGIMSRP